MADMLPRDYAATHKHYWKAPKLSRYPGHGGALLFGPIQFNWYGGFRIHVTWPFSKTFEIWRKS